MLVILNALGTADSGAVLVVNAWVQYENVDSCV
jgi:hypothetical protein